MKEAVIASSVRTPVGKAFKGDAAHDPPDDLAAVAIQEAIRRVPGLDPKEIEDIIMGCAMPEAEAGMNVARNAALRAGLPVEIPAITINRFCSSGLQSIAMAAERIMAGYGDVILAGGTESMTMIPDGRQQGFAESLADGPQSGCVPQHGADGGKCGPQVRHHARARRRIFPRKPSEGPGRDRRRKIQGRNRPGGSENDRGRELRQMATPRSRKPLQLFSRRTKVRAPTRASKRWRGSNRRFTRTARPPPETVRR